MKQPVSMESRLAFHSPHAFKLGLFGFNVSSGPLIATKAAENWSGDWESNLRVAQMADDAGFDFLLPLGRWKGYGGETDAQGTTLETVTWAAGLLAQTKRISAFATIHAPLLHPLIAAKEMVTVDHLSGGRFGLNLVCGWNEGEFDMFGASVREHEERYVYAQEWLDAVRLAWSDRDDFDFDGKYIRMKGVRSKPKPYGGSRPVIMNAGRSPTGEAFALRNCDAIFTSIKPDTAADSIAKIARFKEIARTHGRETNVFSAGPVVCRRTRAEAEEFWRHCTIENADWGAVDGMLKIRRINLDAMTPEERERTRRQAAWGSLSILGDPDDVARQFASMHQHGVRGFAMVLVNYTQDLPFICAEVLPRLARLGLRAA